MFSKRTIFEVLYLRSTQMPKRKRLYRGIVPGAEVLWDTLTEPENLKNAELDRLKILQLTF